MRAGAESSTVAIGSDVKGDEVCVAAAGFGDAVIGEQSCCIAFGDDLLDACGRRIDVASDVAAARNPRQGRPRESGGRGDDPGTASVFGVSVFAGWPVAIARRESIASDCRSANGEDAGQKERTKEITKFHVAKPVKGGPLARHERAKVGHAPPFLRAITRLTRFTDWEERSDAHLRCRWTDNVLF